MQVKNHTLFAFLCFCTFFFGCKESEKTEDPNLEGKLSTDLVSNPISLENENSSSLDLIGKLQFKDTLHDFKTIAEGEKVSTSFEFTNVGKKPILITNAKASCGCTKPNYPTEPIPPAGKGNIDVTFDSEGKAGYNEKTIVVTTNGLPSEYVLTIKIDVKK